MSQPHEPTPDGTEHAGGAPESGPGGGRTEPVSVTGAQPPTESEPAPSTAAPGDATAETKASTETTAEAPVGAQSSMPGVPSGAYMWVPARTSRGFRPAVGRFVRNRATHLVAAVVVGAVVGGGTVAIVDNIANHDQIYQFPREGQTGGPFGGGSGHRFPGYNFGEGGLGSGN